MAKRIVFPEPHRVTLEDFNVKPLLDGQVRIRSECSLMSTGTEGIVLRQLFDEGTHWAAYARYPFTPGYATIGVVEALGDAVRGVEIGQRVAARVPHASHHHVQPIMCTPVPDSVPSPLACWFAFAKIALMGARVAQYVLGDTVAVIGAGPIGQMSLRWAVAAGAREVVAVDGFAMRLDLARRGGATGTVSDPLPAGHDGVVRACGSRPRVVVDSTGNAAVFGAALRLAADRGRVALVGDTGSPDSQHLTSDIITRGVSVVGAHDSHSMSGPNWDGDRSLHELFFRLVEGGRIDVGGLNTHRFVPNECARAYDVAYEQRGETMGVLFDWTVEP